MDDRRRKALLEELWRGKDDAALSEAIAQLADYSEEAKVVIQAEVRRRGLPSNTEEVLAQKEQPALARVISFGAGIGASVSGGALWGLLASGQPLRGGPAWLISLAIGFCTGKAVTLFAEGQRGRPFQVIAVLSTFIGVPIGLLLTAGCLYGTDIMFIALAAISAWPVPRRKTNS